MSVYLIGNKAERDSNSLYVSNSSTTNYTPSDAVNMTRGARHVKTKTDLDARAVIYRNNSGVLDANCCVLAGASRALGHAVRLRTFADCDGTWGGGSSSDLHVWDQNDFGRGLARDFINSNTEYLTISDANQVGLDITGNGWFGGWALVDAIGQVRYLFAKRGASGNYSYSLHQQTDDYFHTRISGNGTTETVISTSTYAKLTAATWYFVFVYHQNGATIGIGLNGGAFNTAAHTTGIFNSAAPLNIGASNNGTIPVDGSMSHWCCGTDISLGPRAIASWLYNGGSGRRWYDWSDSMKSKVGLVSHWSLKESGGTAYDDHGVNHLTDVNTCGSRSGPFVYPEAIEERYGSTSRFAGPPDRTRKPQDLVHFFNSAQSNKEGFGMLSGAGTLGAYEEQVPAVYFDTAFELPNPEWPVVERPAYGVVKKERQYFKTERAAQLTIPFLTRSQVEQIKAMDLDEPIFVYDSEGSHLHDKLWHCIATVSDIAEFDDQYTMTLSLQRLRHYEVV